VRVFSVVLCVWGSVGRGDVRSLVVLGLLGMCWVARGLCLLSMTGFCKSDVYRWFLGRGVLVCVWYWGVVLVAGCLVARVRVRVGVRFECVGGVGLVLVLGLCRLLYMLLVCKGFVRVLRS
jgi:hypothetical protein